VRRTIVKKRDNPVFTGRLVTLPMMETRKTTYYVSPRDILPIPVAKHRAKRLNKRRGKTMVLTASPVLKDLQAQKDDRSGDFFSFLTDVAGVVLPFVPGIGGSVAAVTKLVASVASGSGRKRRRDDD